MTSKRKKTIAALGMTLGLALGMARLVPAQVGGLPAGPANQDQPTTAGTNELVAVETPEKDGLKVYDIAAGAWSEYRTHDGSRVRPIGIGSFIASMPEGRKITQLAAFAGLKRGWKTVDLKEPVDGRLSPIFSASMAVYVAGRRVYAFSAATASWGTLELPEGAKPQPTLSPWIASVEHEGRLYLFNPKFGRWDDSGQPPR